MDNQKFERITVIKELPIRRGGKIWYECICDCGKQFEACGCELRRGKTRSCGCLKSELSSQIKRDFGEKSSAWKGYKEISGSFFAHIKLGAKTRKIPFNLTIKEVWEVFINQNRKCTISGVDLSFRTNTKICDGTASLDRIDSSKSYTIDNVQWVHKDINYMKRILSEENFLNWIKIIYENKNLQNVKKQV